MNKPSVLSAQSAGDSTPASPSPPRPSSLGPTPQTQQPQPPPPPPPPSGSSGAGTGSLDQRRISSEMLNKIDREAQRKSITKIVGIIVVIVVVIAAGYFVIGHLPGSSVTTTLPVTTTASVIVSKISSCTTINSPGTYYLSGSISTSIQNGSCIDITSSNVKLIGNGNGVYGSGPYVSSPPYTYGILIGSVSNVTVTGVIVLRFSYDVYFDGSMHSSLTNSSARNATLSDIYMYNTYNDSLLHDNASATNSNKGGINLDGGGYTALKGDIIQNNAYYGVFVNSTHDSFSLDSFIGNPVDLYCTGASGLRTSGSNFSASFCNSNEYCGFARCTKDNDQYNLSTITLSSSINSCGTISSSGKYTISDNLNVANYINVSGLSASRAVCINIASSNVSLNCDGHIINNSGYGIYATSLSGLYNISITGCAFSNDTYGLGADHVFSLNVSDITAEMSGTGIYLHNVTTGTVSKVLARDDRYGLVLNGTSGITLSGVNADNNTYGTSISDTGADIYAGDTFVNNTDGDLTCVGAAYTSTTQTVQSTACGTTSCAWGAPYCRVYAPPLQTLRPLSACAALTTAGNYSLTGNVIDVGTSGTCFSVDSSGVNLDCNDHTIFGTPSTTAISGTGTSNMALENCNIYTFGTAISLSDANDISITNVNVSNSSYALTLLNSNFDSISNVTAYLSTGSEFTFTNVDNSSIVNDTSASGLGSNPGFNFTRASHDTIVHDTARLNAGGGFSFVDSTDNNVTLDTGSSNKVSDFYCSPNSSGLYANSGGMNTGVTKVGCKWMVALQPSSTALCQSVSSTSLISLTTDLLYTYGSTCYSVYNAAITTKTNSTSPGNSTTVTSSGNNTVINCNGHTIFATNGGTFVDVKNSTNVKIENCVLKYFTTPIVSTATSTEILNDTFGAANVAVTLSGASYQEALNNTILDSTEGILAQDTKLATIEMSNITNTGIGIYLIGDSQTSVESDTIFGGDTGLYMNSSSGDQVGNNKLQGQSTHGAYCTLSAQNASSNNKDLGGNSCSSDSGCNWMTVSSLCKV